MAQTTQFKRSFYRWRTSRHPIKDTALIYLKDALVREDYEQCPLFIKIAKEFGAKAFEIQSLLEDRRRNPLGFKVKRGERL